ncbi:bottleneck [Haematobia irritans]|uniref:bottleneck n=1 Tax=Haematobia irritans TaxID=7368 RepID=UPI003F4FE00B
MSLSAYSFQFYSYNMPSYRPGAIIHNDSMDVDDIDLSQPPPKPPRAAAVQNLMASGGSNGNISSSIGNISNVSSTSHSWLMTSTPKSPMTTTAATKPQTVAPVAQSSPTVPINYFTNVNETPKSIYPSAVEASGSLGEMKLQPRLHIPQRGWSHELRAKALQLSKRGSASDEEYLSASGLEEKREYEAENSNDTLAEVTAPQQVIQTSSWSCQIREKAMEMSQRNAVKFALPPPAEPLAKADNTKVNVGGHQRILLQRSSFGQDLTYDSGNHSSLSFNDSQQSNLNSTFSIVSPSHKGSSEDVSRDISVRDRICYFNTLTSSSPMTTSSSSTFISLLKKSKTQTKATLSQNSQASFNTSASANGLNRQFSTPTKPKRWSTHMNLHLESPLQGGLEKVVAAAAASPSSSTSVWQGGNASTSFISPSHLNETVQTPSTLATHNSGTLAPPILGQTNGNNFSSFGSFREPSTSSNSMFGATSTTSNSTFPVQRKSSLRRKPSIEKSRRPIQRQNSNVGGSNGVGGGGTKPQMHAVMEDLSLVMPVKLRVAEYERRIMMES